MSAEFDALVAQVTANTTVEASAVTLIEGLAAQLAAVASNPTPDQINALATQLKSSADSLAAAIAANTPAAPPSSPAA